MINFVLHNQQNPELFTFKIELDNNLKMILKEPLIVRFETIGGNNKFETEILPNQWFS